MAIKMQAYQITFVLLSFAATLNAQSNALQIDAYELDNGLKVYLNEDKNASNVYGSVWVNAGGKDDPSDATGIAHYLEHMLFKGTDHLGTQNFELEKIHLDSIRILYDQLALEEDKTQKTAIQKQINEQELKASKYAIPNEFDKLIKSIGSTAVNASTSSDYTNYYNLFPGNQLAKWLDIYAHRFQNPQFRLFQSELEAVYEEKNRAGDNLERRVEEKFNDYIYGDHPYSTQTVLGSIEHLKNPSLTKMHEYFKKYYVPNNMALVLSGNFDATEAKPLIEETFGKLKRGEEPTFPSREPNSFNGRVVEKVRITPIKAGFMGYKLVPVGHPDQPALEVINLMMSNSDETGFLDKIMLNNEALYIGGYFEFREEDGSTFIFYVPKIFGKSLNKFENQIKGSFKSIADGEFDETYLESIKNNIYRNYKRSLERPARRGRYLGLSFIYGIDYNELLDMPNKVQKLSKNDIQRVAAKYFGEDYFTMRSRTGFPKKPKLKKPPFKPIAARTEATSEYAEAFNAIPEKPAQPEFVDVNRDIQLIDDYIYYTENPINDVFTLQLTIAGGISKDHLYPLVTAALNNTGTTKYSAIELKNKFAELGTSYSFGTGYGAVSMYLTGLDKQLEPTLQLLDHLLTEFNPTEKTVEMLYNQRKTENKINDNNPSTGGSILYNYGLFGSKSRYVNRLTSRELKALDPNHLKLKLQELVSNGFTSIHYVGQKDKNTIKKSLGSFDLYKRNAADHLSFLESRDVSENTIYLVHDKKAIQSYVYYVVKGEPLNHETNYIKEAFNAYYTNSLSGLLFQEVREFRSLAYSTGGNYIDPIYEPEKKGRLVLFTGSQADKTTSAIEVVMGLIEDMPVYESRTETIKNGLLLQAGSSKPNFRDISDTVEEFTKTGFTEDPNKTNHDLYPSLTFDDIQSFYNQNIKGKPVTVTIYGDASEFDKEALSKFGKVIELKMDDILKE